MKKIPLSSGKAFALVDDDDFEWLSKYTWQLIVMKSGVCYATRNEKFYVGKVRKSRGYSMHREILGLTDGRIQCDHKDENGLNNQRSNLRVATRSQNRINKTKKEGFKGVHLVRRTGRYIAQITLNRKCYNLGTFDTKEAAAAAYNNAAIKLHGEFAKLNIIK
jgi:hypothetical protein